MVFLRCLFEKDDYRRKVQTVDYRISLFVACLPKLSLEAKSTALLKTLVNESMFLKRVLQRTGNLAHQ